MILVHTSINQPSYSKAFINQIDLLESEFRHLLTGTAVTREQLMIVLGSLSEVKLRATYFNKIHYSELLDFEMDIATMNGRALSTIPAFSVEKCYCPANYRGNSCESCIPGYYKVKSNGPGLFTCVPCNCNGHSDQCDQDTGKCIDCRDNTYGDSCEFCKKGYHKLEYGNGQSQCRMCPCPGPLESNVFADTCLYDDNSKKVYYCQCLPG
jgi:laminin alpha 3/5